jgi:hypothetical protein
MLVCDGSGVAGLEDLGAGTVVTLAIGAEPELFTSLSGVAVPEGEPDPLGFTVDVGMRRVLAAGEVCMPPSRGRCGAGTLCLPEISTTDTDTDTDGDDDVAVDLHGAGAATAASTRRRSRSSWSTGSGASSSTPSSRRATCTATAAPARARASACCG